MDLTSIKSLVDSILLAQRQWDETEQHFRAAAENPDAYRPRDPGAKFVYHLAYTGPELARAVSEWLEVGQHDVKRAFEAVLAAQYDAEHDADHNGGREEIKHLQAQARAGQELAQVVAKWLKL